MKYNPNLNIVLHQPEIPQNTGAIGRTCVALGAKLWLVRPLGFQLTEKALRRAGLDYWQHLEWEVVDHWDEVVSKLQTEFWFFTKTSSRSLYDANMKKGATLVFGSESTGLPDSMLREHHGSTLQIPIRPEVRSLNLSCSVAIAGYELHRQISLS
ncbi:MAG: tRNA (cytidine(34)-2'-O)-methyltransferase [Pirellulaceae bacterium]|nr:tRNA (cytidine(34)-2'-O)-methyltransferase [Pirellulaceae bacterium]